MRFIVVGVGAIGGVIGGRLHQHGHDVVLVAHGRHGEAIRRDGLRIESPDETVVVDVPAVEGLDRLEIGGDDVVLLAVKSQDTAGVLETLIPHVPPSVAVVCAQNGIENERLALRRFANVYGVVVMCPSAYLEPGVVQVFMAPTSGNLDLGRHPSGGTEVAYAIRDAFRASTFRSEVLEDVLRWKYAKLVSNLDNAVEAVCGPEHRRGPIGELARQEGAACLHAAGIDFEEAGCAARAATIKPRPIRDQPRPGASSWQSLARRTGTIETDYLNGEIVLLGRLAGCPVPVNELLQELANSMARNRKPPGTVTPEEFEAMLDARSHPRGRLEKRP
jgi:2-dehydropantoate 2-reductase